MKWLPILALVCAGANQLAAQSPSYWRQNLSRLPETPSASTSPADIAKFEHDMQLAAPYFARIQPNDYEANRAVARRMAVYLAGLQMLAHDPQMRQAVGRAQRTFNSLPLAPLLGYPPALAQLPPAGEPIPGDKIPAAPAEVAQLPFSVSAPVMTGLPAGSKGTADELCNRYEADASRAAAVWQNAETLRRNLAGRGMALNTATSSSLMRLASYFNTAQSDLHRRDWDEARTSLMRAEAETEKIMKAVGR